VSPWFHGVAEREHEIQNPTSAAKIRLLGERMRLGPDARVLDVAAGRGGPALVLAHRFGCRVTCVERDPDFAAAARSRAEAAGLEDLVDVVVADAATHPYDEEAFDAALCLGASFVWGGLEQTLAALQPAVHQPGYLAIGEPFWRVWPLRPDVDDEGWVALDATVERFESSGVPLVSLIAASEDDWDRYESLHWQACEEWLAENPQHPESEGIRDTHLRWKSHYLRRQRGLLGWAIFIGWKR
jgi:SAM-dependent methyltransferase